MICLMPTQLVNDYKVTSSQHSMLEVFEHSNTYISIYLNVSFLKNVSL